MQQAPSRAPFFVAVTLLLAGCPPADEGTAKAQAPQIVVQQSEAGAPAAVTGATAPPGASKAAYAGANWQNQGKQTDEPFEVQQLLREHDPQLIDDPNDQKGDAGWTDLISAFAVIDARYLYARVVPREPMAREKTAELRFWLEQGPENMATVEVKIGTREKPCEISDVKNPEKQSVVPECFWLGNAIDIRIPRDAVPPNIDMRSAFHVSGFQTCCVDEARTQEFDVIDAAQEVWRIPGLGDELEVKDGQKFVPGNEESDGKPNVP